MIKSRFFDFRLITAFLTAVLFVSVLVTSGCTSDKKDGTEPAQKTDTEVTTDLETATPEGSVTEPTPGPERTSHGPPQELLDACTGMVEGDSCTVTVTGGREIQGACKTLRSGDLACMPQPRPGKSMQQRTEPDDNIGEPEAVPDDSDGNN
ncbi:MAG: hypothetical protein RIG61_11615 [Deltaproteobacteria bacterium]